MNNHLKGLGISFLFHGAVLCSLFSMGTILPTFNMTKVIDLSLVNSITAPQKQLDESAPSLKAPPTIRQAFKPLPMPVISKISVPVHVQEEIHVAKHEPEPTPEPVIDSPVVAEKISEEMVNEAQVSTLAKTDTVVADTGLVEALYVEANLHYIKDNIQKRIVYPRLARKMSWEGKVIVSFVVDKDGNVQDVHIVESSGFTALDKNAIATIEKAAPYPCPPVRAELVVPVIYRLA